MDFIQEVFAFVLKDFWFWVIVAFTISLFFSLPSVFRYLFNYPSRFSKAKNDNKKRGEL